MRRFLRLGHTRPLRPQTRPRPHLRTPPSRLYIHPLRPPLLRWNSDP